MGYGQWSRYLILLLSTRVVECLVDCAVALCLLAFAYFIVITLLVITHYLFIYWLSAISCPKYYVRSYLPTVYSIWLFSLQIQFPNRVLKKPIAFDQSFVLF